MVQDGVERQGPRFVRVAAQCQARQDQVGPGLRRHFLQERRRQDRAGPHLGWGGDHPLDDRVAQTLQDLGRAHHVQRLEPLVELVQKRLVVVAPDRPAPFVEAEGAEVDEGRAQADVERVHLAGGQTDALGPGADVLLGDQEVALAAAQPLHGEGSRPLLVAVDEHVGARGGRGQAQLGLGLLQDDRRELEGGVGVGIERHLHRQRAARVAVLVEADLVIAGRDHGKKQGGRGALRVGAGLARHLLGLGGRRPGARPVRLPVDRDGHPGGDGDELQDAPVRAQANVLARLGPGHDREHLLVRIVTVRLDAQRAVAGEQRDLAPLLRLDRLAVHQHVRLRWIDLQDQDPGDLGAHPVEQIDDLRRQSLAIDGVGRVELQERREVGLGAARVAEVELGAPAHVVGGAEQALLLDAQVPGLLVLARLDHRRQLARRAQEVEVLDPLARPVEGGAHRLQVGGEVLLLLRERGDEGHRDGAQEGRRENEPEGASGHH